MQAIQEENHFDNEQQDHFGTSVKQNQQQGNTPAKKRENKF